MDSKFSLSKIDEAAANFLLSIKEPAVIAFHGEMGAGKTTFISALCRQLQVADTVSSPTYAIINHYKTATEKTVYHLDLYRLKDEEEALQAGVEECLYSGNWCFVEWPERASQLLPTNTLHCYLTSSGNNERKLQIK
ncbi:MAG: tRNA (adenosine(37)-N6)-threonylcarbamoyltransferase complex ATPase subunit type 1 TsaE [Gloeobacteraceae cyanobacterium ES-bin-316]|nr:tRNA (adenosine(37)-N6)-threonylcarbamoyltransferase complex ATPase subunit type 1 TsaE [Ferruginibacter sp.]